MSVIIFWLYGRHSDYFVGSPIQIGSSLVLPLLATQTVSPESNKTI